MGEPVINSDRQQETARAFHSNIFSIAAGADFLNVFVRNLMCGKIVPSFKPETNLSLLGDATIYVPNRRSARALAATFLETCDGQATILPKIRMLGDVDDQDFGLHGDTENFADLPNQIGALERKLELALLIEGWIEAMSAETRRLFEDEEIFIPSSRADAIQLAESLCQLLNQITQEEIPWNTIQEIIPDRHNEWWRLTASFLQIVMEQWPQHLEQKNLVDPMYRHQRLLELRTEKYLAQGSKGPVIVAGSTGSVPSTQRLLQAISKLENGAIVLPGLDFNLSSEELQQLISSRAIDDPAIETHGQFGLARLVTSLGVERDNIIELTEARSHPSLKAEMISLALSSAQFTANWRDKTDGVDVDRLAQAFSTTAIVEAVNERQEAQAIAIAMREVLEEPEKTAALVTPDRKLARRVAAELGRFNINIDDTAGTPLQNTASTMFLRKLAELCFGECNSVTIASVLKDPLCLAGMKRKDAEKIFSYFEVVLLRGVIQTPVPGNFEAALTKTKAALASASHVSHVIARIDEGEWQELFSMAQVLDEILLPIVDISSCTRPCPLSDIMLALITAAEKLTTDEDGSIGLLAGIGGSELKQLVDDICLTPAGSYSLSVKDFPPVFDALLAPHAARPRYSTHPRLHIMGPLEVRLLDYDRIILGGLNEGTWPQTTRNDPFLNRIMRTELNMASPERRTGLSAHDFEQLINKREVILSRAQRVDKAPSVASRWLQRLTALLGDGLTQQMVLHGNYYLDMAIRIDEMEMRLPRASRPCPTPPVEVRPTSLAVTDIETWIRDPYALYAKHVLKLTPIPPLEREADALLRGTLYHDILHEYVSVRNAHDNANNLKTLLEIASRKIETENLSADLETIWKLRFGEIAEAFINWEENYLLLANVTETFCETKGSIKLADGNFKLRARADRIDKSADGLINVVDYKTGINPSIPQARTLSPQLSLEGAIARQNGFSDAGGGTLNDLIYLRLRRGKVLKQDTVSNDEHTADSLAQDALNNLLSMITAYSDPRQGYLSRRAPFREGNISGEYDHLARTREWAFGEDGDDGDE